MGKKEKVQGIYQDLHGILEVHKDATEEEQKQAIREYFKCPDDDDEFIENRFIWAFVNDNIKRCHKLLHSLANIQCTMEERGFSLDPELSGNLTSLYNKHEKQQSVYKKVEQLFLTGSTSSTPNYYQSTIDEDNKLVDMVYEFLRNIKNNLPGDEKEKIVTAMAVKFRSYHDMETMDMDGETIWNDFVNSTSLYIGWAYGQFCLFLEKKSEEFKEKGLSPAENDVDGCCAKIKATYVKIDRLIREYDLQNDDSLYELWRGVE